MTSEDETDEEKPWHSSEPMARYDSLFPLLPDFVAHYTIGGTRLPRIGIANKHDLDFRESLLASLLASRMQIGTTYAEKRYPIEVTSSRWLGLTDRIDTIFNEGRRLFDSYQSLERQEFSDEEPFYRDLPWQFFYRALGSFDAAKRLSELGYLCEVATILRSALEQFAFCAKLRSLETSQDFKNIRAIQSLNHLKTIVPAAGRLYGLMSKYTHFEFDHHTHFFSYSPSEVQTIQRAPVLRAYATQLLLISMACIGKYVLAVAPSQFREVPAEVNQIRRFIEKVDEFSDDVCRMLPLDEVLARMDILLQDLVRDNNSKDELDK